VRRLLRVFKNVDKKFHWVIICAPNSFPSESLWWVRLGLRAYICAKSPYAEYVAARQICEAVGDAWVSSDEKMLT